MLLLAKTFMLPERGKEMKKRGDGPVRLH